MLLSMREYGIGNTPLISVPGVPNANRILIKQEGVNHLGSVKARTAYWLVAGLSCDRSVTIVESSSGNLALALDYFCRIDARPFRCLIDETIVQSKLMRLKSSGVDIELVSARRGMDERESRIARARQLDALEGFKWTNQYDNPQGIMAHYRTTGMEILQQTNGHVDFLVCAVGSGGTIIGTSQRLKQTSPNLKTIAVEPLGSTINANIDLPYINAGAGLRGAPGNIVRNQELIDQWVVVQDSDAVRCAGSLNAAGLSSGITTGMAYFAALKLSQVVSGKTIVVISPDGGEPYGYDVVGGGHGQLR